VKKQKFYISLYILIPLIYAGLSIIGVIVTYQFSNNHEKSINSISLIFLIAVIGLCSFLISIIILRIFLQPFVQFVQKTKKMPIFTDLQSGKEKEITDELGQITEVFDNVANILSKVEAKELFPDVIASSSSMRSIFTQIMKVAPTDSTVLISGESGTGKELIAQGICEHSLRKDKPFIKINCVAIPEGLLESELFGHEKGSFTGAITQRKGKFEIADGGTVFLDEIGDMPLNTQAKLLRVLQEREFERVGGTKTISVDIRFIAATNKKLPALINDKLFREDLYFRLNVFSVFLPPLRERQEDISILANYFLEHSPKPAKLSTSALQGLIGYSWPGNIRELKNVLEQASILCENRVIELRHLPEVLLKQNPINIMSNFNNNIDLDEKLKLMEKEAIIEALKMTGGVQVKAANLLGINQRSLWHRIKKLEIDVETIK
jgi:transcriptional regulator with PAS, ATPase and Fis domain